MSSDPVAPVSESEGAQPMQTDGEGAKKTAPAAAEKVIEPKGAEAGVAAQEPSPPKIAHKDGPAEESKGKDELTQEELKNLNVRQYLEKTVVPVLMQGMQQLVRDRPDDPCEALASYLKEHNPKRKPKA